MAQILPPLGKIVDVILKINENRQLIQCRDCEEEMVIASIVDAQVVSNPELRSLTHNLICPKCKGLMFISLRSQL